MQLDEGELNIKYVIVAIITIIGTIAWFYQSVVVPINQIQLTLITMQTQLVDYKNAQSMTTDKLNAIDLRLTKIESK